MKVKIGDKIYDTNQEPIMLMLNDVDKENISNMGESNTKYCAFPESMDSDSVKLL